MTKLPGVNAEILRITATPSRLAAWLAPKIWGPDATFEFDPWLQLTEQRFLAKFAEPGKHRRFLGVNAPPQTGKSFYFGVAVPLWVLGHFPNKRIIRIGYSDDVVQEYGALARDIFREYGSYLFGLAVDEATSSRLVWGIQGNLGSYRNVGIKSSITGKSGDLVLIDDLLKDLMEAGSKATKDLHWDSLQGVIKARIQPGGMGVLSATRFAADDVSGRQRQFEAETPSLKERWEWLSFPAIAEAEPGEVVEDPEAWRDVLGRRLGEPLKTRFLEEGEAEDPERWPDCWYYVTRDGMASTKFIWDAVYQQNPTSPEGGMFPVSMWQRFDLNDHPPLRSVVRVWDTSATSGGGDWTVGAKVGIDAESNIYVLDIIRIQVASATLLERLKATILGDGLDIPVMIERGRNGDAHTLFDFYVRELSPATVRPAPADGSKEDRARPHSMLQQQGKSFLPQVDGIDLPWVDGFVTEHSGMMGDGRLPRHDDQVDATAHAVNELLKGIGIASFADPNEMLRQERQRFEPSPESILSGLVR